MATRPLFRFKFELSEIRKSLWALKCPSGWSRKTSAAKLAFTELLRVQLPVQPDGRPGSSVSTYTEVFSFNRVPNGPRELGNAGRGPRG